MSNVPEFKTPDPENQTTTESGLKYEVLEAGEGDSPAGTDMVTVHYAGWLTDGSMFDASYSRGVTASFPLNGVISGWTEGLQLMKPGGKFVFEIPSDLAYGPEGRPPVIPPAADLIFLVELVKIGK